MARESPTIKSLVQGFAEHIRELKAPEYKESQVRLHYIDQFWKLLGWDIDNSEQRAPQDVEVQVEPSMDIASDDGLRSREPDYRFRVNGFPRFIVEAKKPAVNLDADEAGIFQAKRYAWSASIPFAILTDFEQFRLFDATLKPDIKLPARGLVEAWRFDYPDYPGRWDEFVATFGRQAVAAGSLETLLAQVKKVKPGRRIRGVDRMLFDLRGAEPIDREFLGYLEKFRQHFARAIYQDNKKDFPEAGTLHGAAPLTETVQRLIDRLVFMRVCEDRGVSEYGDLRKILNQASVEGDLTGKLRSRFRQLDREYNGYIFKVHRLLEQIVLPEEAIADFVRTLYPPDGPWDFAKIGDDILGIVYERFLGHTVTVRRGAVHIQLKPEYEKAARTERHAKGVYYTPRFVVDSIIRRVMGPKIAGKSPAQVLDVKILDPACGSGSFLVAAFQYLIDHCLAAVRTDPTVAKMSVPGKGKRKRQEIAFLDARGEWYLAPDFRAALLTNCIHGVDIDQQAVEVTVMSLYLKMLESKLPEGWATLWVADQLLPSLDANIACGNSLIDEPSYDAYLNTKPGALYGEDADTKFRINRFNWDSRTRGFGRLLDSQALKERGRFGFDGIIGNPPYIRVQELNEWAREECEFYKWKYKSAGKGSFDIYMVFTERCLSLLAPDGLLGFIMPHKFWQNRDADALRKMIADGKHLRAVVDFGDQQVFAGATTYTAIHVLAAKNTTDRVDVAKVTELSDGISQCAAIDAGRAAHGIQRFTTVLPTGAAEWRFHDAGTEAFLGTLRKAGKPLFPDICEAVFQGIVTGADPIFLSQDWKAHPTDPTLLRFMSEEEEKFLDIERGVTVPVVRRQGFEAFVAAAQQVLILPYDKGTERLLPAKEIAADFPLAWSYLKRHQKSLAAREKGRFADSWWCLSRAQNIQKWLGPKVLVPYMIDRLQAVADDKGAFFVNVTTGGYGLALQPEVAEALGESAHDYMVGLLNSQLLDWAMRRLSNHFHGGYYPANKQYLQHLPIKLPKTADEKKNAARIAESVRAIMDAKTKLRDAKLSDREHKTLEGEVESLEARIDHAVFALYGVKGLPED